MAKLLCLLGDSLKSLHAKGEIKQNYYNPQNLFSEVHFITRTESDIPASKVKMIAGEANVFIHAVGPDRMLSLTQNPISPLRIRRILSVCEEIRPDVVRSYDPLFSGYYGVKIAKHLHIPLVISVHTDMDDMRSHYYHAYKDKVKYCKSVLLSRPIERYSLSRADEVLGVYQIAVDYAKRYGGKNVTKVFNKVPTDRFHPVETESQGPAELIFVGNFIPGKNQETLIRAMKGTKGHLTLIGSGPLREACQSLAEFEGVAERVTFIESVANSDLHTYYQRADLFVSATTYGETAIPVLEAMACGLPCIIARPRFAGRRDLIEGIADEPENTPLAIAAAITELTADPDRMREMSAAGRQLIQSINDEEMQKKEAGIYRRLLRM